MDRFEDLAAHVEAVERSVRRVDEIHGAEPVVRRADKLGPLIGTALAERDAVRREQHAMHQIVLRITDDGVAIERFGIRVAAIDRDSRAGIDHVVAHAGAERPCECCAQCVGWSECAASARWG